MTPQKEKEIRELIEKLKTKIEESNGALLLTLAFPLGEADANDEAQFQAISDLLGPTDIMIDLLSGLFVQSDQLTGVAIHALKKSGRINPIIKAEDEG